MFKITPDHGLVVLSTASMCFYSLLNGALYIGRSKVFGKNWAASDKVKALRDEHEKAMPGFKFSESGYPDMGNGRYAATLSYKEWFTFNNQQRAHYNLIENFSGALTLQMLAGLYFPRVSSGLAVLWIAARHIWARNYIAGGPENRYSGLAGLHIVSVLGWFGMAVYGGVKLTGLVSF